MSSLLLQLPPEVLLEIIELSWVDCCVTDWDPEKALDISWLFRETDEPEEGWRGNPLEALRLTCKYLSNLCTPTLFQSLDVTRLKGGDQLSLFKFISKSGHVVKGLSLNLVFDSLYEAEAEYFNDCVLGQCSNVRRLTVFHTTEDKSEPRPLFDKIRGLPSLEEIHIIDAEKLLNFHQDITPSDAPHYLAHQLLDVVLDAHASRLRTVVLFGVTPLTTETFEKIQQTVPNLHRLEIIRGLAVHHRESLANPAAWACAANLQHVSLTRCRGAHAAIFTRQLAAGAIGHLRTLHMSICGAWSDDETLPGATKWTIPALEVLELDHFAEWEMRHFAMIHAKKVFLSRVWQMADMSEAQAVIMAMGDTSTFPEMTELHVRGGWGGWSVSNFEALRAAGFARGLKVVERDWWFHEITRYTKKRILPLNVHTYS